MTNRRRSITIFRFSSLLPGVDVIGVADKRLNISSMAIVGIAVAGILLLLIIIDFLCCVTVNLGIFAMLCRKPKRSPSDLDEEKFGR